MAARAPGGGQLVLAGEGRYQHGVLWLFSCSGPERFTAWLDATDQLLAWRAQGLSESEIAPRLRSTYCAGLLGGG